MSINRVNLSGNLTRDAELRQTQGGSAILSFGIAVNDRRRNPQSGEWEDVPNYIDCTIFGNRAQAMSQFLTKGTKVALEGRLRWSQWTDKNSNQKRSKLEVVVDEIEFLSARPQNAPQSAQQPVYAPQQQQRYANPPQQHMPPQMAPQAPVQGYAAAPGVYQPAMPQQPQMQQPDLYDESIPF